MKKLLLSFSLSLLSLATIAQDAVGINTTTPHASAVLDIHSTSKGLLIPRMSFAQRTAISSPDTGLLVYQNSGTEGFYYYDGNSWEFVGDDQDWTETPSYLYTDEGLNVGIGTTTPDTDFHIYSDDKLEVKLQRESAGDTAGINFYRSTGSGSLDASIYVDAAEELIIQNHGINEDIKFIINDGGTEKQIMYFDASNNKVGFNISSVPQELIHADGVIRANSGFKGQDGSASVPTYRFYNDGNNGMYLSNTDELSFSTSGSQRTIIDANGDVLPALNGGYDLGNSSLRWGEVYAVNGIINTSDSTLKANIQPLPYGLNEVLEMNAVSYNWKSGDPRNKIGVLAQEMREIAPEVVYGEKDGELGVNYAELVPVLIKAIQELSAEVETLKAQVGTEATSARLD